MRITAKADYAVRAAVELAAAQPDGAPVKGEHLAKSQGIPQNFLENILTELRRAGIVRTRRGADGGYQLARPAREITVADVLRAVEGPLAAVQGMQPQDLEYPGAAEHLPELWIAVRASLRVRAREGELAGPRGGQAPEGGGGQGRRPRRLAPVPVTLTIATSFRRQSDDRFGRRLSQEPGVGSAAAGELGGRGRAAARPASCSASRPSPWPGPPT